MSREGGRCGLVAMFGRSNVGKSTLLNRLVGQKLSITSPKPQTTRYRILGIKTVPPNQVIYVDAPGWQERPAQALSRAMNLEALGALEGVDLAVFMVEALRWSRADERAWDRLKASRVPVLLAINKVDEVKDKRRLLPYLKTCAERTGLDELVPISARHGDNLEALERCILAHLPRRPWAFPAEQVTDRPERFFAAEIIREKLMRTLEQELPYAIAVVIDEFSAQGRLARVRATIWVQRPGQRRIVVGEGGAVLKRVGMQARRDLERMLGRRVFLETWVKVKPGWAENAELLREVGLGGAR